MEYLEACISPEIFYMKKTLTGLIAVLIIGLGAATAQSEKETKPPPPPKTIIDEKIKVKELPVITVKGDKIDEKIKMKEPPTITIKGKIADKFYKQNPSVAEISRQATIITLKMKEGTEEKYDMSKIEEDKSFTEKYGISPIPPPPPPRPKKVN